MAFWCLRFHYPRLNLVIESLIFRSLTLNLLSFVIDVEVDIEFPPPPSIPESFFGFYKVNLAHKKKI